MNNNKEHRTAAAAVTADADAETNTSRRFVVC